MRRNLLQQVARPEGLVGFLEMAALVTAVAVHAVRVYHEVEFCALAVQYVYELKGVLEVSMTEPSACPALAG